jgi:hypothetical protein
VLAGDQLLLVGSDGRLMAISPLDGRVLGSRSLGERFTVPPVVADGTVYLLDDDGELSAYR